MSGRINRRLVLAERPRDIPGPQHFRRDDRPIDEPGKGELLVRNRYLSIDPAQRGWVSAGANYSDPVPVGAVMRSLAVAVVESSRDPAFAVGEHLYGWFGWQEYCLASAAQVLRRVDPGQAPLTANLSLLGIPGLTAYLALVELARPQRDETVLVSTAAGAVGSVVGQLARRAGCRVVGITGSAAKAALCRAEYGYDAAVDYKDGISSAVLADLCPRGVDVFFDNTSGPIADAVIPLMNVRGRIIQCGTAAVATWEPTPQAPRRERAVLVKRLRHEGFIIFDHVARFPAVCAVLAGWLREGSLLCREHIEQGLDQAPHALAALYRGENQGKTIVEL